MFIFVVMNIHNKLREIGFNKTAFHKPYEYNDGSHNNMVLDNVTRKWDYIKKRVVNMVGLRYLNNILSLILFGN